MRACGPEHLRASQTCYCLKLPRACRSRSPSKKFDCCKNNSKLFSRLRSRSLTELTRQITPPTKNGHAPPPSHTQTHTHTRTDTHTHTNTYKHTQTPTNTHK